MRSKTEDNIRSEIDEFFSLFPDKERSGSEHISSDLGVRRYIKMADEIKRVVQKGKILDWGAGIGQMTYLLKKRGLDVVSYDVSPAGSPIFEKIGQKVIISHERVRLPFADSSFDAVLSSGVLEHVDDPHASLSEIRRILKKNGSFFVYMLPNRYSYVECISDLLHRGDHPVKYSLREVRTILERSGFEVRSASYQNFLPYNLKGFSGTLRRCYYRFSGIIRALDSLFIMIPLLRTLSTNLQLISRKKCA